MFKPLSSIVIKPAGPDCNLDCRYCFYLDKKELFPEASIHRMKDEILEELIRQTMQQSGQQINFLWQGGEPALMGLDFYQRVIDLEKRYGTGKVVGNGFQTNGTLLNEEWANFFKKHSFLVGLSLDGPKHIHDKYRVNINGLHSWERVMQSAKLLVDKQVEVNAMVSLTNYSASHPEEIYNYFKTIGITWIQFIPIVERNRQDKTKTADFSLQADTYTFFLKALFQLWYLDLCNGNQLFIRYFENLVYLYSGLPAPECTLSQECGNYLVIEHNGDVFACDFFVQNKWKLGNIMENRLIDMLNSKSQKEFGKIKSNLDKKCSLCKYLPYCFGGCPKDRLNDPADLNHNHFCKSIKNFLDFADPIFKKLAHSVKQNHRQFSRANTLDISGFFQE